MIGDVVRDALRAVPSGEVLVVDDGSTDGTDRAARRRGRPRAAPTGERRQGVAVPCGPQRAQAAR